MNNFLFFKEHVHWLGTHHFVCAIMGLMVTPVTPAGHALLEILVSNAWRDTSAGTQAAVSTVSMVTHQNKEEMSASVTRILTWASGMGPAVNSV